MRKFILPLLLCLALTTSSFAWSNEEHIQLTRLAAMNLVNSPDTPEEMKAWLRASLPGIKDLTAEKDYFINARVGVYPINAQGIAFWATVPDLDADSQSGSRPVKPYPVPALPLHFTDLEYYNADESKRVYADDLSNKPKLEDIPRDVNAPIHKRAGMLPFRIEECYKNLVKNIKEGRLSDKPGQFPRDEHAMKWAGFLAHYAEDNTQPQHATEDYQSARYFKNERSAPKIHPLMEYELIDGENNDYLPQRTQLWTDFEKALAEAKDPIKTDDVWQATVEISLTSYDALPMIGRAAVAAYGSDTEPGPFDAAKFMTFEGNYLGKEMTLSETKAHQLAWAVKRVERVWLQAWKEAHAK